MHTESFLKAELNKRKSRYGDYDHRRFAGDMGISPAFLSLVLNGKRRISEKSALKICEHLKLSAADKHRFMTMCRRESSKDPAYRKMLSEQIDSNEKFKVIDAKKFSPVSRWCHTAIIELSYVKDFEPEPAWIARRLRISVVEAELSLARLLRLGFLTKTPSGKVKVADQVAVKDMPSRAIREHHTQMISKALAAVEGQPLQSRDISGITMAISKSKLPLVNEIIRKFRYDLADVMHCEENDAVYQLNIQFFRLDAE